MDYIKTNEDILKETEELNFIRNNVLSSSSINFDDVDVSEIASLKHICNFARNNNIPVILDDSAKLLIKTVAELKPIEILEIGTAIGYSGTIMLDIVKNSKLTTIEKNKESYLKAVENFKNNSLISRVNCILGDAKVEIEKLKQQNKKYDFIFLDGPKGQYINYFKTLNEMLNVNGVILADNVLFKGMVLKDLFVPHRKRTIVVNLRKYIYNLLKNDDYKNTLIDIGDGVLISKKIKE